MKRKRVAAVLVMAFGVSSATATGVPTVDVVLNAIVGEGNLATAMSWTKQAEDMKKEYDALQKELTTLDNQYKALTGASGKGALAWAEAVQSSQLVPADWRQVVGDGTGAYKEMQQRYRKLTNPLSEASFSRQPNNWQAYQMSTASVQAGMAGSEALYAQIGVHMENLFRLNDEIDKAQTTKEADDLRNRIAIETALLQTAMGKAAAVNLSMQANSLNQQNQRTAATNRFYTWPEAGK